MDYVRKLPLMMASISSIMVGLFGYLNKVPNNENIMKMSIVMVIFYVVGLMIRNTIINIIEMSIKKAEEKRIELKRLEEEKRKEEIKKQKQANNEKGQVLDLVADNEYDFGSDDEFDALPVADFIKKELNQ